MKTIRCQVESINYLNHDTRQVLLRLPGPMSFRAGQYLEMILPNLDNMKCPFSIASAPSREGLVELHIRPTPGSADSDAVESLLNTATEIDIIAPKGNCYLENLPEAPLVLIAASTGITQMKSIVEEFLPSGLSFPLYLYWGVVSDQDLYLAETCKEWAARDHHFHFIPVVSNPETSKMWTGKTGLVGEVALNDVQALHDVKDIRVVVGGSPGMVYATLDMFTAAGMPEENMRSDVFDYAPRNPQ